MGFGGEDDEWLSRRDLEDCEALDVWESEKVKRIEGKGVSGAYYS